MHFENDMAIIQSNKKKLESVNNRKDLSENHNHGHGIGIDIV